MSIELPFSKNKKGWKSKHKNVIDPVFLGELEHLIRDISSVQLEIKPSRDFWPDRPSDCVPSIFKRRKIFEKLKINYKPLIVKINYTRYWLETLWLTNKNFSKHITPHIEIENQEYVDKLKKQYPGVPVVSYVNTSADVKAETDVCCTSANAVKIVKSLGVKKVIFLPDDYLAKYVASQTDVEIISWKGICIVHDQFNKKEIEDIRKNNPGIKIIAHPECPPDVIEASDFAGSTSGMIKYVKDNQPKKVMMVTECSMSDNIQIENPNVDFVKPCNMCPHMKKITLPKILDCLENETGEIIMDKETIEKARISVERMAAIGR